ncbi:MAG: UDP-N-acetylmuramate--L-alanine ligase [Anaerolineae bacterium]|nr:UDP-N-acetylmuramate--L-alanine ligase [Anaerolineae bacterium]
MLRSEHDWLSLNSRVHFVGVGGIGLSAIARVLLGQGFRVSGSDMRRSPLMDSLRAEGVVIWEGHARDNVNGADLVVVSSAVPEDNPEVVAARSLGIPVVKRDWVLGRMMQGYYGIAVAGTHGKTTTSAMIAFILERAGWSPTFVVGGIISGLDTNGRAGKGKYFVVEADEYDRCFLGLRPDIAVVTNIEMDHPDCYADLSEIRDAFTDYLSLVSDDGLVVICGDCPTALQVLSRLRPRQGVAPEGITYGMGEGNRWRATELTINQWGGTSFNVRIDDTLLGNFATGVPGRHNVLNGLAALAVTTECGVSADVAGEVLRDFHGVRRRFEYKGNVQDVLVYDDYAHHPTEIQATLAAARMQFPEREIWAVFQPHTYSRTLTLMDRFASSFGDADHVVITDIYPARERDSLGVHAKQLVERMAHPDVHYIGSLDEVAEWLAPHLKPGAFLVTLGAGSITVLGGDVLRALGEQN